MKSLFVKEVARMLSISTALVYELCSAGKLRHDATALGGEPYEFPKTPWRNTVVA